MKIRTQFIISSVIFTAILAGLVAGMLLTNRSVQAIVARSTLVGNIRTEVTELNYLSNDYLLYHEPQLLTRWQSKFASIHADLDSLAGLTPGEQSAVNDFSAGLQNTGAIFNDALPTLEALPVDAPADAGFIQLYWSRLEVQNQVMHFDTTRLEQLLDTQERHDRQTITIIVACLTAIFGVYLLASYFFNDRRILAAIRNLEEGASAIGKGDLDFRVTDGRKDEIGELAHSFNRMTENLKEVTASKAELERQIEARRKVEEDLKESEERFFKAFQSSPVAQTIAKLPEGRWADVNEAFVNLVGFTREELIGHTSSELNIFDREERARILKIISENGPTQNLEVNGRTKDGRVLTLLSSNQKVSIGGQEHSVSTVIDITERKKAEAALVESEAKANALIKYAPTGIYEIDFRTRRIVSANDAMSLLTGYSHDELLAIDPGRLMDEQSGKLFAERTRLKLAGKPVESSVEYKIIKKDGTVIDVVLNTSFAKDKPYIAFVIGYDITERKRADETLRETNRELKRFNDVAVGRELRMIELKKEINRLSGRCGQPAPYPSVPTEDAP